MFYFLVAIFFNVGILACLMYIVTEKRRRQSSIVFQWITTSESLQSFGIKLGITLSLVLSITYAFTGVFIVETFTKYGSGNFLFVWALGSPLIFFVAISPAVIIGIFTGFLLGILTDRLKNKISSITIVLLGITVCTVITVLTHYIFNLQVTFSFANSSSSYMNFGIYETYPFYMGIPSIIYILSGGWASWYIYKNSNVEYKSS